MLTSIISFLGASILLTISPGPDNMYVLVQGITHGKKAGITLTIGLVSGIIVHTSLVAFGISALIQSSSILYYAIQYFGVFYLLYLAYKVYKSNSKLKIEANEIPKMSSTQLLKRGFLMNVLNPKVTLFFLALLPGFLWNYEENTVLQFYVLGGVFIVQAFLIFSTIAWFADYINQFLTKKNIDFKYFNYLQIVTFISIAVFILFF